MFGVICVVYSSILFSRDPEWVGWAAPLVFGGAPVCCRSASCFRPPQFHPTCLYGRLLMLCPKPLQHSPPHRPGQAAPQLTVVV